MRSTFFGIEIGRTGLQVSQKGLDVSGHNIANVDTEGYTRQRLVNTAYEPYNAVSQFKPVDRALVGSGAHIKIHDQIRDAFLDRQFRSEYGLFTYWNTRTQGLTYVESLFEGAESADISAGIDSLYSAFKSLEHDGDSRGQRKVIQQSAINLCQSFNLMYERLIDQQASQNLAVKTVTNQINTIAHNISVLNKSIYSHEMDGLIANDLRDKRNLLLDELSSLIDIEYVENAQDYMVVTIDGEELVNHTKTKALMLDTMPNPIDGEPDLYVPAWENGAAIDFNRITGGELKAHMVLRDQDQAESPGIPYFVEQLNTLARALAEKINEVHKAGYTHPATGLSVTGVDFFEIPAGGISKLTAGNFSISALIAQSEYNIAASSTQIDLDPADPEGVKPGNQENALALYKLLERTDLIMNNGTSIGSFLGFMDGIVQDVAVTLNHSKNMLKTVNSQLLDADTQRISISGVSLDEEMTHILRYQHAYSGSSRVITAMDEALDTLINRMGRVGL